MDEIINSFKEGLIEKTKAGELNWKPLSWFDDWKHMETIVENGNNVPDFEVNSIRISNSFYLKTGEGYVFLFELCHGNPEITSPEMDTIALMVRINQSYPVENLTSFAEEEQKQLRILQLYVEKYCDEQDAYSDLLSDFLYKVIEKPGKDNTKSKRMTKAILGTGAGMEVLHVGIDDNGNIVSKSGVKMVPSKGHPFRGQAVKKEANSKEKLINGLINKIMEQSRNVTVPDQRLKERTDSERENEI